MGKFKDKILDNSGKNTQNEIYDTSHRQYWNPPGQVAWKDNLVGFFGIVLSVLLVMLIDCYLLHPIAAPEGTFAMYGGLPRFSLTDSNCEYADSTILAENTAHRGKEMYLVEQDGEIHLIRFHQSILFTRKISNDVVLENAEPQTVKLSGFLRSVDVRIDSEGRIDTVSGFELLDSGPEMITVYIVLGVVIAVCGSVLLEILKKSGGRKQSRDT